MIDELVGLSNQVHNPESFPPAPNLSSEDEKVRDTLPVFLDAWTDLPS